MLAPLGSVTLAFNVLFAWLVNKTRPTWYHLVATLLIGGGATLVAIYGYVPQGCAHRSFLYR